MTDEDLAHPSELLRNLRELVELDRWFGVQALPRSKEPEPTTKAATRPEPRQRQRLSQQTAAADTDADAATVEPLPDPCADIDDELEPAAGIAAIAERIASCERCGLCTTRKSTVPGEGDPATDLMFVGEGPGADEDRQGRPFVGAAGQLLDKMIQAMGFQRSEVFIANIVKCRPPGNRTPNPTEVAACLPYLERQIAFIRPKIICTLGNTPLRALTGRDDIGITRHRGKPFDYHGVTVIPTFHPSYLLRNQAAKKPCWEDLQQVVKTLGRELPPRG